eukprot:764306-Hanusia_phi.AAC.3
MEQVFEAPNSGLPPGHVKTSALERALTTYGTEKLTVEEAQDLLSQVRGGSERARRGVRRRRRRRRKKKRWWWTTGG